MINETAGTDSNAVVQAIQWEAIVPLDKSSESRNEYPVGVFPDWVKSMIDGVSLVTQTPRDLSANVILSIVAGAIAGRFHVDYHATPLNLWILTMYPSGGGKSPVCNILSEPLKRTEVSNQLVADITPEQLVKKMDEHGGKAVVIDSEGSFIDNMLTNRKITYDTYLHAYSEEPCCVTRSNKDINMQKPSLSLGIMTQTGTFARYLSDKKFSKLRANGLIDRFLLSAPPSLMGHRKFTGIPDKIDAKIKSVYDTAIANLANAKISGTVTFSDGAEEYFVDIHQQFEDVIGTLPVHLKYMEQYLSKLDDKFLRLAAVLAVMDNVSLFSQGVLDSVSDTENGNMADLLPHIYNINITAEILERALKLVCYYFSEYATIMTIPVVYGSDRILSYLQARNIAQITRRDLIHAMNGTKGLKVADKVDASLAELENRNYLCVKEVKTGGPVSKVIFVNPSALIA